MSMTRERLRNLIEAYGASPDRWPDAERDGAVAILAELPEADEDLRAAQALDALLDAWRLEPPTAGLADQIAARAIAQRGPVERRSVGRRAGGALTGRAAAWIASAGLAAACAAGVLVGVELGNVGQHGGDAEAAGSLLDGASAFGAPTDLEKSG